MGNPRPKISVALCTYNGGRYLPEQLATLAGQSRRPDELVICDDRSNDDTLAVARSFAQQAAFAVVIHVNNKTLGTTKNFERAIELCTGDLIALCDQDDIWHPQKLANCEEMLLTHPRAGMVLHDAEIVDENLRPFDHTLWDFLKFDPSALLSGDRKAAVLLKRNPAFGHTLVFRASFKNKILPIPADVAADMWIGMIVGMLADVALIRKPLAKYRQHADQQTGDVAKKPRFLEKVRDGRSSGQTDLTRNLNLCEHAYARLQALDGAEAQRAAGLIREKADHLRARTNLPSGILGRIPVVLRELVKANYHHYSNGSLSALKDLLP